MAPVSPSRRSNSGSRTAQEVKPLAEEKGPPRLATAAADILTAAPPIQSKSDDMAPRKLSSLANVRHGGSVAAGIGVNAFKSPLSDFKSPVDTIRAGFPPRAATSMVPTLREIEVLLNDLEISDIEEAHRCRSELGNMENKLNRLEVQMVALQAELQERIRTETTHKTSQPDKAASTIGHDDAAITTKNDPVSQQESDGMRTPTRQSFRIQAALNLPPPASNASASRNLSQPTVDPSARADRWIDQLCSADAQTRKGFSKILSAVQSLKSTPEHAARVLCAAARSPAYQAHSSDPERSLAKAAFRAALELDFDQRPHTEDDPIYAVVSHMANIDFNLSEKLVQLTTRRTEQMDDKPFESAKMQSALAAGFGMLSQRLNDAEQLCSLKDEITQLHADVGQELAIMESEGISSTSIEDKQRIAAISADLNFALRCAVRLLHHDVIEPRSIDFIHQRFIDELNAVTADDELPPDVGKQVQELLIQTVKMKIRESEDSPVHDRIPNLEELVRRILDSVEVFNHQQAADALVGTYVFHQKLADTRQAILDATGDLSQHQADLAVFQSIVNLSNEMKAALPEEHQRDVDARITAMLARGGTPFEDEMVELPRPQVQP